MNEIYPNFSEPKYSEQFFFEIMSWIGRKFYKKASRFVPTKTPFLVDLGVGENYTDGWTHVDCHRSRIKRILKSETKKRKPEIETDLRYPLDCPSNSCDGVYTGHTLEHLFPNHAYNLLSEIFRILKPGCWLRINVPDLKRAIDFYNGTINIPYYTYKAEAVSNLTQNWGHHSAWDAELLSKALEMQGFINISEVEFGKTGTDSRLIKEEEGRREGTVVLEAQKPIN
jgi:predicted SAM-dependent methyltransferase